MEAGRTLGGVVWVISPDDRRLAKPLSVSLKRKDMEEGAEAEGGEEAEEEEVEDEEEDEPISWSLCDEEEVEVLEELTEEQFESGDDPTKATVCFTTEIKLEQVAVWLTPSLGSKCLMVISRSQWPSIPAGTTTEIELMLTTESEDECDGTIHIRDNSGDTNRTWPDVLGVELYDDDGVAEEEVAPDEVVSGASFSSGAVAPGQLVSIFGLGLGNSPESFDVNDDGTIDGTLGGTMVLFDGIPAPLLSVFAGQVNTIVPAAVSGDDVELRVLNGGQQSVPFPVPVRPAAPALFVLSQLGKGQAAALNRDGTVNSVTNPAARGEVIQMFGTGGGETDPVLPDGTIVGSVIPTLVSPVTVIIGGLESDVLFAGSPPGLVYGVTQFNVLIPDNSNRGPRKVTITVGDEESSGDVIIWVM